MDLINSQIISDKWDAYWSDASGNLNDLTPRSVLVATTPFASGSPEEAQLRKMMQACQLQEEDYNIIQFNNDTKLAWHFLRDLLEVRTIILLGVTPEQLGVSAQLMPHQVSRFNDCVWIVTGPLDLLMTNHDIKGHVWNYGLKPVFVDKVYG
jgi:hypothetical protein